MFTASTSQCLCLQCFRNGRIVPRPVCADKQTMIDKFLEALKLMHLVRREERKRTAEEQIAAMRENERKELAQLEADSAAWRAAIVQKYAAKRAALLAESKSKGESD